MLTGYQTEVVAFTTDTGAIVCPACAAKRTSTLTVEKAERGLDNGGGISAWIRYTLDEYIGENASNYADGEYSYEDDPELWQDAYDNYPDHELCDDCGEEIS